MAFQPPPRRADTPSGASSSTSPSTPADADPSAKGGDWKSKLKAKGTIWGQKAIVKGVQISDNVGGKVNNYAEKKFGTEHFWPVTGDFAREMDKCARILRAFTVEGVIKEEPAPASSQPSTPSDPSDPSFAPSPSTPDAKGKGKSRFKDSRKVLRKIPPKVIANAKGLVIFTAMRTGIAPFGGAGGTGVVIARLPDGSWSAPSSISPNNLSAGFLLGVDVYDAVLIINSVKALESFKTHKATIGAELGLAAGPYGSGVSMEAGLETAPIWSYVKSRGMYAGVEVVGQVFVERFDENAGMYHWPGIKAGDILTGRVKVPPQAAALQLALQEAETGVAQSVTAIPDGAEVVQNAQGEIVVPDAGGVRLNEGEVLNLPPTPSMLAAGPPKLPPRMPARPSLGAEKVSSDSIYETPMGSGAQTPAAVDGLTDRLATAHIPDQSHNSHADATLKPHYDHDVSAAPFTLPDQAPVTAAHDGLPPAYNDGNPGYPVQAYGDAITPAAHAYPDEKAALRQRDEQEAAALVAASGLSSLTGAAAYSQPPPAFSDHSAHPGAFGMQSQADEAYLGEMSEGERREWAQAHEDARLEREEQERAGMVNALSADTVRAGGASDNTQKGAEVPRFGEGRV